MPARRRSRTAASAEEVAKRTELLAASGLLVGASDASLSNLALAAEAIEVTAGTEIVKEGRLPTYLFLVERGELDVLSAGEGSSAQKVNVLGRGDCFGEVGLLEGMPSTATVRASTPCSLYRIHGAVFLRVVAMSPALSDTLLERVRTRLETTHPSYRPATEGRRIQSVLDALPREEIAKIESLLLALRALDSETRARLLEQWGAEASSDGGSS